MGRHGAEALAAGYTRWHRAYEVMGILVGVSCATMLALRAAKCPSLSGWWTPLAALLGLVVADFLSGLVHWLFDTWGSVDTPVLGKLAIRTFRHHHVDGTAITRHDFIETNGHNFMLSTSSSLLGLFLVVPSPEEADLGDVFVAQTLIGSAFFTAVTSQIHKWAHMSRAPRFVQLLQRARLVLSPEHHDVHHASPFTRNYCITVGWMNGPLRAVRFFETLEWTVSALTGAVPRGEEESGGAPLSSPGREPLPAAARSDSAPRCTRSSGTSRRSSFRPPPRA